MRSIAEGRLRLMAPAIVFMWNVEWMYLDVEEGRGTPEQIEPWVRVANSKIEQLIPSEDLKIVVKPGAGEDRYRLKYFTTV
jgi:hypothetical protein